MGVYWAPDSRVHSLSFSSEKRVAVAVGRCPSCELSGPLGEACGERGCRNRGYHFIPPDLLAQAKRDGDEHVNPMLGRVIGDFLVVGTLGAGGFGAVYLALQRPRHRLKAALKLMHASTGGPALSNLLLEKFQNEGDALAVLHHPNIVRLLKYGQHGGQPYLVMECVEGGRTLHAEVRRLAVAGERLPLDVVHHVLSQTVNALASAHAKGIVHRDLKPENVMLQAVVGDPHFVRVLDFGLAKFIEERTQTSVAMGTPMYMAPEQIHRRDMGPWTDLYAAGVIAFELMTGRRPFGGASQADVLRQKVDPAWDPASRLAGLDVADLALAFFRCALAPRPAARYRSADEFLAALGAALEASEETVPLRRRGADLSGLFEGPELEDLRREAARSTASAGDASAWPRSVDVTGPASPPGDRPAAPPPHAESRPIAPAGWWGTQGEADGGADPGGRHGGPDPQDAGRHGPEAAATPSDVDPFAPPAPTGLDDIGPPRRLRLRRGLAVLGALVGVAVLLVWLLPRGGTPPGEAGDPPGSAAADSAAPAPDPPREWAVASSAARAAGPADAAGPPDAGRPPAAASVAAIVDAGAAGGAAGGAGDVTASEVAPHAAAAAGAADVAAADVWTVRLRTDPPGAVVQEGGERLGSTPLDLDGPAGGARTLTLSRKGYEGATVTVTAADAPERRVALERGGPRGRKPARGASPPPPRTPKRGIEWTPL